MSCVSVNDAIIIVHDLFCFVLFFLAVDCGAPTSTPSGAKASSLRCPQGTLYGESGCTYSCAAGYSGTGYTLTCGTDGSWSQIGSCTASSSIDDANPCFAFLKG